MAKQVQQYKDSLQSYDLECVQKTSQIRRLNFKIRRKNAVIHRLDNDEGYKKIKEIAKREIELVVQDNRQLLTHAVSATLEAIRRYPAIQELMFELLTAGSTSSYQQSWIESHRSRLMELSEHIQMEMKQQITNDVINNFHNTNSESENALS